MNVEAIYSIRSPAKSIIKKGSEGEADLRLSLSSGRAHSLTSNGVENTNKYAIANAIKKPPKAVLLRLILRN